MIRNALRILAALCASSLGCSPSVPAAKHVPPPSPVSIASALTSPVEQCPALPSARPTSQQAAEGSACPAGMVQIPGGTFLRGSERGQEEEKPVAEVTIADFCLDATEVTVCDYRRCVNEGRCTPPDSREQQCNWDKPDKGSHPVNCVDWQQAQSYCASLGNVLPTEAQWEYAARGGAKQLDYPWGNAAPEAISACWRRKTQLQGTCAVGSSPAGVFGLKDMAGNVWEWVADWYGKYPPTVSSGYAGPADGNGRVLRGGSWYNDDPSRLRGAARSDLPSTTRHTDLGFRCAKARAILDI